MIEVEATQGGGTLPLAEQAQERSGAAALPRRPRSKVTGGLLFLADLASLALAALLGGWLWQAVNPLVDPGLYYRLWPMLGVLLVGYALLGLYPAAGVGPVDELRSLTRATTVVYLAVVVVLFLTQQVEAHSRGIYLSSWLLSLALVPLGRAVLRHFLARRDWWGVPVVVLGAGKTGEMLVERLNAEPGLGFKVIACLDDRPDAPAALHGVPVLGPLADAPDLARKLKIRHALLAMPGVPPRALRGLVQRYAAVFEHLIVIPDLFGMASLGLAVRDLAGVIGLHGRQQLLVPANRWLKRGLELCLMVPVALVSVPILMLAALWIMAVSRGSPFYAQRREGYLGKPIHVWKLRTMHHNAEVLLERHLNEHPEAKSEWERFYKLANDPRVLPGIGQLLRKTSLDELPQIWNVLKGEMSLVGPRPFPYYHIERFDDDFRSLRCQVRPGITGLWQVSARSEGDLEVQERLDSYYIRNWSLWLDVYVLARTPWAVLFGKGAY